MGPFDSSREYYETLQRQMGGMVGFASNYIPPIRKMMQRRRHKFLYQMAEEIVYLLEFKGVKREEGCELRALVEKIWDMEKDKEDVPTPSNGSIEALP